MATEDFIFEPSMTYKAKVGCGNRYITIVFNEEKKIVKVIVQRNSKCQCPNTYVDGLSRQSTFQAKRDIEQAIQDLKGDEHNHCDKFNISVKGAMKKKELGGFSCGDAVARVLDKVHKEMQFAILHHHPL